METTAPSAPTSGPPAPPAGQTRAPQKKKLWTVSPSQVDAYRRCPRVWYNQTVLGDREPSKPFQEKGTKIHKALEIYLTRGEVVPQVEDISTLEFVQVAIPHLAVQPKTDTDFWAKYPEGTAMVLLEEPGEMGSYDGGPGVVQYIDVVAALPKWCRITDYKTLSDFRYCKTPEELAQNTQLCWNAKYIFAVSDYEEIEIEHLYLLTKGRPKAKPVRTVVTRDQVEAIWARDMATVKEMVAWAELGPPSADALPPNTESCDMYGGCFYRAKCGFDVTTVGWRKAPPTMSDKQQSGLIDELLKTAMSSTPDSAVVSQTAAAAKSGASELAAILGGVGKTITAPAPAASPLATTLFEAPAAPAAPAPPAAGLASILGASAPDEAPKFAGATKVAQEARVRLEEKRLADAAAAAGIGIVPPDAPSPVSTPEEVAAANAEIEAKEKAAAEAKASEGEAAPKKRGRKAKGADAPAEAPAEPAPQVAITVSTENGKSVARDAEGAEVAMPAALAPLAAAFALDAKTNEGATPTEVPASVVDDVEKLRIILTTPDRAFECGCEVVFIDCLPQKGWGGEAPTDLAGLMHAFERIAAQAAGKQDYRFIPYESKGYLAQAVRVLMRGLPKAIYLDSHLPGGDVFLSVVTPYAKMIFRGTR